MRDLLCPNCGQHLTFENSVCLSCGSRIAFSLPEMAMLVIASGEDSEHGGAVDSSDYRLCGNLHVAACNWLVKRDHSTAQAELCVRRRIKLAHASDSQTATQGNFQYVFFLTGHHHLQSAVLPFHSENGILADGILAAKHARQRD